MEEDKLRLIFFILWVIVPTILTIPIAFFLFITFVSLGIAIDSIFEGDTNTLIWAIKPALGFFVIVFFLYLPSFIIFGLWFIIKKYFKSKLKLFYKISIFLAICIISIIVIMALSGEFNMIG